MDESISSINSKLYILCCDLVKMLSDQKWNGRTAQWSFIMCQMLQCYHIISQTNAIQWNDMSMWQRREVISDRFFSPQIHFRFDSFRNGWTCMSMANEMSSSVVDDIYAMLLCTQGSSVLCLMIQRRWGSSDGMRVLRWYISEQDKGVNECKNQHFSWPQRNN